MVSDTKTNTLMPDSVVYTEVYRSCNALDVSCFHHERMNHKADFAKGKPHINDTLNFWNQAKRILRKHNRIDKAYFHYPSKKYEFHFIDGTKVTIQNIEAAVSSLKP